MENKKRNSLGTEPINQLLRKFAVPSIIAMLVSALYNIVDQFFIGRSIGELGNAATNITFPLTTSCIALALLLGIGAASAFNLTLGKGDKEKALYYIGNSAMLLFLSGLVLCIIVQLFLQPMLLFFGSPENVLGYAENYTRVTAIGFPFLIFSTGGGHLIRADGSPKYSMLCNLSGAIINIILDPIFIFGLNMGMVGAGLATIIGQIFGASLALRYLFKYKTGKIERKHLIPNWNFVSKIISLGAAPFFNQLAMMIVQIVMNKSLTYYGALSVYGESIPLACAGIITKVNQIYMSIVIGLSQGLQPIVSFNYGAAKYDRVKKAYSTAISYGVIVSVIAFLIFQFMPRQIVSIFGSGSEAYYSFAVKYFRIFLLFTFINCFQPISSNFFTAIGKPKKGIFLSLTRQILFLLPLIIILPLFIGIDGIMYSGPIADFIAGAVSIAMIYIEFKYIGENRSFEKKVV
ncbi:MULTISPECIES: MATE family efflux transporter [unclassified Clostridium]|uniref:MATE family efflux transporter n=1 Tax=Clostridium TaxID=1485 RepID=UPI001C8BB5C5|nr:MULTISPECIES: MATE family efflux transporter [unclassified Clostridium]MBX9138856.1 MATE family efflux transporter [Clostridium sp. K12(2020)]MBX9145622.1 MATE family efflux transporter [Clostridium sp. K13]